MKKSVIIIIVILVCAGIGTYFYAKNIAKPLEIESGTETVGTVAGDYTGKKVLYIDSYHAGYEWSDGITSGVENTLADTGVELKIHRMDTKRNTSDEFKEGAALEAKALIESFDPDVVIVSDDNAFKYIVMPYYKNAELPFVFCGLNWDASIYGAPYTNTTGMVEVAMVSQLLEYLNQYSDGERIGYLAADVLTSKKEGEYYKKLFNIDLVEKYATDMADWKEKFIEIEKEIDILIIGNNAGINDWDAEEAKQFVMENAQNPSGAIYDWMTPYSLVGFVKVPKEQGEWSAESVLRILDGTPPSEIPVTINVKGKTYVNLEIAEKLGVVFRPEVLKNAEVVK